MTYTTPNNSTLDCRVKPLVLESNPAEAVFSGEVIRPGDVIEIITQLPGIKCSSVESMSIVNSDGRPIFGICGDRELWTFKGYQVPSTTSNDIRPVGVITASIQPKFEKTSLALTVIVGWLIHRAQIV